MDTQKVISNYRKRLFYLFLGIVLLFFVLFIRVVYLTFLNPHTTDSKREKRIQRGIIYDKRGNELAISQDSSTIGIDPSKVFDISYTASQLSPYIDIAEEKIETLIKKKENYFLLKREVDNKIAKKIKNLKLPGIRIEKEFKRVYPNNTLAANLIGFTGMDDDSALAGLEYTFHKELLTVENKESYRGNNIYLSIDKLIQYRLESVLREAFIRTNSKKAIGVFMNVHSGEILAMASFPTFNPNYYNEYPDEARTNWAIRYVYEPGSTMKIFMAMLLLNEHEVDFNEKFYCPGYVEFGDRIVRCTATHGLADLDEILQYSCNVGIIKAIRKIPDAVIYKYLKEFKFGEKTGLFENESQGYFPELSKWNPSTAYFMAIGQGISVTPIQLITSAATVVNGGKILTPIIVTHITDSYGNRLKEFNQKPTKIGIKKHTTSHMLKALTKVVSSGTGKNAFIRGFSIGGKTGTGQKSRPGRGYEDGLITASFLGFFPANDPQIVGLILFDEPGGVRHTGGGIAAPVFKKVVKSILPLVDYENPISSYTLKDISVQYKKNNPHKVPNFKGLTLREALNISKQYKIKVKVYGSGFCYKQIPEPYTALEEREIWKLYFR